MSRQLVKACQSLSKTLNKQARSSIENKVNSYQLNSASTHMMGWRQPVNRRVKPFHARLHLQCQKLRVVA